MATVENCPADFRLVLHYGVSDGHELPLLLLAKAGVDGTLQLLSSGWERALGYPREQLNGSTLLELMWSNRRHAAAAVAAILDDVDMAPVAVRMRCRNGRAKGFRLHRHYDGRERKMYIVAEETAAETAVILPCRAERRGTRR